MAGQFERAGKLLAALVVYIILEVLAYIVLGLWLRVMAGDQFDYLDWVFLFYFPEKKIIFFYYLVFMVSTWGYFLVLSVCFNLRRGSDVSVG